MLENQEMKDLISILITNFDFDKAKEVFAKLGDRKAVSVYKTYVTYWDKSGGDWNYENSVKDHKEFESQKDLIEYFKSEEGWNDWLYKDREDEFQVGYTLTYGDLAILMDSLNAEELFQAIVPLYWANCENVEKFLKDKNSYGWQYEQECVFKYTYNWKEDCFENVRQEDGYVIRHYDKELIHQLVEYIINGEKEIKMMETKTIINPNINHIVKEKRLKIVKTKTKTTIVDPEFVEKFEKEVKNGKRKYIFLCSTKDLRTELIDIILGHRKADSVTELKFKVAHQEVIFAQHNYAKQKNRFNLRILNNTVKKWNNMVSIKKNGYRRNNLYFYTDRFIEGHKNSEISYKDAKTMIEASLLSIMLREKKGEKAPCFARKLKRATKK